MNWGCARTDGTFSIVFVKQNIRTPRVACRWLETITAAEGIGNEQQCSFIERRIVTAGALSALAARALVRDYNPAPKPSLAGHRRMTPMGEF